MNIVFLKKIILISIIFVCLFSFKITNAFEIIETEEVVISARVGLEVEQQNPAGGVVLLPQTAVRFSGRAYSNAQVILLKDGQEISSVVATKDAYFTITLPEKVAGEALYTLYARDLASGKSLFLNFPLKVHEGFLTYLDGILFAPTINTDKTESVQGDYLRIFGYAIPKGNMEIEFKNNSFVKTFILSSKTDGTYDISVPLLGMQKGDYIVSIKYKDDKRISKLVNFKVGEKNVLNNENIPNVPGDCNKDSIINLIDFSVLAFWYGKENPPICVDTNRDGQINLTDFSILAFYWTG